MENHNLGPSLKLNLEKGEKCLIIRNIGFMTKNNEKST